MMYFRAGLDHAHFHSELWSYVMISHFVFQLEKRLKCRDGKMFIIAQRLGGG